MANGCQLAVQLTISESELPRYPQMLLHVLQVGGASVLEEMKVA